jgi:predicted PurR-regulated permease PerM
MTVAPIPQPNPWTFRRVVWATLVFAFVFFCFWVIYRFYDVLFTLFIGVLFGTVIRPIVNWLNQRGVPKVVGVSVVYVLVLLFVITFLWLLFPVFFQQGATITRELPNYYQSIRNSLVESPNLLVERLGQLLPSTMPGFKPVAPSGQDVVNSAEQMWGYVLMTSNVVFKTVIILLLILYWAIDGPRIIKSLLLLVPQDQREGIGDLITEMESRVGFYMLGQVILCTTIGILALIAYLLIGLPNAMVLALAAGVLEAVPMLGPTLGAVPASLVALSIAPSKVVWVILATIIIQQMENSLLVPRIMHRTVGVNPFVTLLALFAFGNLFGIPGALMAIPMAAIIQLIMNHFVFKQATVELHPAEGRNYVSRLRYEAQDLIQDLRKQARHKKGGSDEEVSQVENVMDEIEAITTNLDALLAQANATDEQ